MSCGNPHETDCSEVLAHVYEYLDGEMPVAERVTFKQHLDECSPCLREYGIEEDVKRLVKRSCLESAPIDLRARVLAKIAGIRAAESAE
jgi:anti-sigma factor (TIGR02949 family)